MRPYFALTICGLMALISSCVAGTAETNPKSVIPAKPNAVVALGRIQPNGEVIKLSVANAQDSRVDRILIKEGDFVKRSQVIAVLQGIDRKQADFRDAIADVNLRQIELGRTTQTDVQKSQIAAQTAVITKLQAQPQTAHCCPKFGPIAIAKCRSRLPTSATIRSLISAISIATARAVRT